ncbi:tRNA methyltransferase 10 B like protein [Tanacetum coccineum]
MLLKKTTKIATKLLLEHQTLTNTLTCRPNDIHNTFIPPRDYQFSCSSTPGFNPKRKSYHRRKNVHDHDHDYDHAHALTVTNVKRVFDILNEYETVSYDCHHEVEQSPLTWLGFGERNKNVRQLRVTDSPFQETVDDTGVQVDKKADEFIKNFYNELKMQKKRAAIEPPTPSPSRYQWWNEVRYR